MKQIIKQVIVFVIIGLMLNIPLVISASTLQNTGDAIQSGLDESYNQGKTALDNYLTGKSLQDLGEAIIINVGGYEPSPIPQSTIENGNVPVYIYLKGTTFGTLATYLTGESQSDITTGISNIPPIKAIDITPDEDSKEFLSSFPKYITPTAGRLSLDNLGIVVATIKQIKNEKLVPQKIDLNFSAKIYFDLESGGSLFGLSQENLILNLNSNEQNWLDLPDYQKGKAFADRVFIRAVQVRGTNADFEIYDKNYNIIPAKIESVYPGFAGTNLNTNKIITLGEGNEQTIQVGTSGDLFMDSFILKLNKIIEPADKIQVKLSVNGKDYQRTLVTGSSLYPNSKWKIASITQTPAMPKAPTIMDQSKFIKYLSDNNIKIVKGVELTQDQLKQIIPPMVYFRENKISLTNGYDRYELKSIQATKDVEGKNGIFSVIPLTPEQVSSLESLYCPKHAIDKNSASCESINSFKEMIEKYPSNDRLPQAYFNLGHIYGDQLINPKRLPSGVDELRYVTDMNNLAYYYYNKILEFESDKKLEAMNKLEMLTTTFTAEAFINDENVYLQVLKVIPLSQQDTGTAAIKNIAGGSREYKIGDTIDNTKGNYNNKEFYWKVKEIFTNRVTLVRTDDQTKQVQLYINSEVTLPKGDCTDEVVGTTTTTQTKCDQAERIKLENTNVPVELDVTVTPGTGKAFSTSNFQVHLLIDKRAFELSPDQLKDQIKRTQELIKKLDKVITKLDKIVREWKKTCLVTSTYLMIKNSFLVGNARNEARKTIMPVYGEQCKQEMGTLGYTTSESKYRSLSGCYIQKADEIEKTLDAAEASIKKTDEQFKLIKKEGSTDPLALKYNQFTTAGGTDEQFKNYLRYTELQQTPNLDPKIQAIFKQKTDEIGFDNKITAYTNADTYARTKLNPSGTEPITGTITDPGKKKEYEDLFNTYMVSSNNPQEQIVQKGISFQQLSMVGNIKPADPKQPDAIETGNSVITYKGATTPLTLDLIRPTKYAYILYFAKQKENPTISCITKNEGNAPDQRAGCLSTSTNDILAKDIGRGNTNLFIDTWKKEGAQDEQGRPIYINKEEYNNFIKGESVQFYLSNTQNFANGVIRNSYAQQKSITAQFTLDGYPWCYPIGDIGGMKVGDAVIGAGDYVLVLSWYKAGSPQDMQIWNVGPNGLIECGKGDDELKANQDALKQSGTNEKTKNRIEQIIRAKQCTKDGQTMGQINAGGSSMIVTCSTNDAKDTQQLTQPQCTDLMDPSDCKLLFNVCDPVMCPTSRCNLGGRWHVDNVIASGIIGSTILCLPNRQDGIVMPVCLTGILAGLKNIKTILQGYESCLQTSLDKHENVGMCDYIRSVGICELAWKEVIFIIGAKGGVIDWALGKLSPKQGGGEYLNFRQSFDQLTKSFNYFTTEYSESLLAQYKSKSTSEIGTEVCRMAIAGKFPNFGEVLNEMSEPEEPPQFMAVFDSSPSVAQAGLDSYGRQSEGQSLYRGFYHIYAGKAYAGTYLAQSERSNYIQYSVYLRDSRNPQQTVLYVTKVNGKMSRGATLQRGTFTQESINVFGSDGYNQICVVIDGKTYCGTGKTSSAFSVGALQDQLVADEISRQNIQTAADCNPSYSRTSPSLSSLTMPQQFGMLNSGIVRICNPVNPGAEDRWVVVGNCGKDANGKDLGSCWLDKTSISVNDAQLAGDIAEGIEQKAREINGITGPTIPTNLAVPAWNELRKKITDLVIQMNNKPLTANPTGTTATPTTGEPTPSQTTETYERVSDYQFIPVLTEINTKLLDQKTNTYYSATSYNAIGTDISNQFGININNKITIQIILNQKSGGVKNYNYIYEDQIKKGNNIYFGFRNDNNKCLYLNVDSTSNEILIYKNTLSTSKTCNEINDFNGNLEAYNYESNSPEAALVKVIDKTKISTTYDATTTYITINPPIVGQTIKTITGQATELTPDQVAVQQKIAQQIQVEKAEEIEWYNEYTKISTPVEINGETKQVSYEQFISWTLSPELTGQALFYKGEYFMKVAERLFTLRAGVILLPTTGIGQESTPENAAQIKETYAPTINYDKEFLTLTLNPSNYYKVIVFSGSNFATFNSVKDKTYFKDNKFSISFSQLKSEPNNVNALEITHVTVQTYDGVINLDKDIYTSTETMQNNAEYFNYVRPVQQQPAATTSSSISAYQWNDNSPLSVLLQGNPSLSPELINQILKDAGSPAVQAEPNIGQCFYDNSKKYGIDDAIALAFFKKESTFGKAGVAKTTKAIGNIRPGSSWSGTVYKSETSGEFRKYNSWCEGVEDWYKLIKNSNNYVAGGRTTVETIVPTYAPNNPTVYISNIRSFIKDFRNMQKISPSVEPEEEQDTESITGKNLAIKNIKPLNINFKDISVPQTGYFILVVQGTSTCKQKTLGCNYKEEDLDPNCQIMYLFKDGKAIKKYPVSTGLNPGRKLCQGTKQTPQGDYTVKFYNSKYSPGIGYMSNYPNQEDLNTKTDACNSGGSIAIHGPITEAKIGERASNGCVRMCTKDIQDLHTQIGESGNIPIKIIESTTITEQELQQKISNTKKCSDCGNILCGSNDCQNTANTLGKTCYYNRWALSLHSPCYGEDEERPEGAYTLLPKTPSTDSQSSNINGIEFKNDENYRYAFFDKNNYNIKLVTANALFGTSSASFNSFISKLKQKGAIIIINAGFMDTKDNYKTSTPVNLIIENNKLIANTKGSSNHNGLLIINGNNIKLNEVYLSDSLFNKKIDETIPNIQYAIQGPRYIVNGNKISSSDASSLTRNSFAFDCNRGNILLIQSLISVTTDQLKDKIINDFGCKNAIGLDGGGSRGFYYNGQTPLPQTTRALTSVIAAYPKNI